MNLHCRYEEYEDQWVDMAVTGPIAGIAELVRKCASLGISGFVITIENDEDEKEVKAIEKAINILNLEFSVVDFAG
ncbi:hypothetical protein SAMN02745218_02971 [Desulfofundulus australicus DSM 11792]|uniref:Uncharacterized protein n=2 Tax=Desulfofundulus australicus TaxID=1566 RepID=A0A1M5E1U0_9FIRM|nr:hypothetical protein SAMN02745218_02971 [Desulfofundulus australicus DSM 11792]